MEGKYFCFGILALVCVILFACSWDTVEPTEWGIKYNTLSRQLSAEKVYTGGRYFVWIFTRFINFPSTLINIEFSERETSDSGPLNTRTKEGLALGLHMSFQLYLDKEKLPELYYMTGMDYKSTYIRIARDAILQVAGEWEAPSFWQNRTEIGEAILDNLKTELKKAYGDVLQLQFLRIDLPKNYENSIVDTQVEQQKIKMKQFEQQATYIRKQIQVDISEANQQIKVINATANSEAYYLKQQAVAKALTKTITSETWAYSQVNDLLNITTTDDLSEYIYYVSLMGKTNSNLILGMNNAYVGINNSG